MSTTDRPLSLRWPRELIDRIDQARGLVNRSAWLRDAAEHKLASGGGTPAAIARVQYGIPGHATTCKCQACQITRGKPKPT